MSNHAASRKLYYTVLLDRSPEGAFSGAAAPQESGKCSEIEDARRGHDEVNPKV